MVNNKKYVGQTTYFFPSGRKCGSNTRWAYHVYKARNSDTNSCRALAAAIRKYGAKNFTVEILLKCRKEEADYYECKFIDVYNTLSPKGYNIDSGGSSNKKLSLETRMLISNQRRYIGMSQDDINTVKLVLSEFGIDELPFGINYTHNHKNGYEGFTVSYQNTKLRAFIAKGRTLLDKLIQALTYLDLLILDDPVELELFNKNIIEEAIILEKKAKINTINTRAKEAMINVGVNTLPMYVRYENRGSRFYVKYPDKPGKYGKKNDPEVSLVEILEYIQQQRESV